MSRPSDSGNRKPKNDNEIRADAGEPLYVPGADRMSMHDAALAYAEAGWYVLPVELGTKNLGKGSVDSSPNVLRAVLSDPAHESSQQKCNNMTVS
jgi:hypothetical protein